ncbi:hypothetical protein VNO80_22992 [Phaseolus coccineus]|uniref:Uncharacterized protein n=1 Tax=Phaseolus coccineus TaxID=3886 RepID=A0AAN9M554_PHACN
MGCFMACFGLSNKRKRRKTLYKVLAGHQRYGNYEVLAITEKSIILGSDFRGRDEVKEQNSNKSKNKKVTFNLYRYMSQAPLLIRYYNCTDGHGEEDEMAYEDSDIDDYDDDGELDDDEQKEFSESCYRSVTEDEVKNQMPVDPSHAELKSSGQDRSMDMHSVLSLVENLSQWKAIKTKVAASSKHRRKENVPSNQQTSMALVSEASFNFSPCSLESNAFQSKPDVA